MIERTPAYIAHAGARSPQIRMKTRASGESASRISVSRTSALPGDGHRHLVQPAVVSAQRMRSPDPPRAALMRSGVGDDAGR